MDSRNNKTPALAGFVIVFFVVASLAIAGLAIATHRHPTLPLIVAGFGLIQLLIGEHGRPETKRPTGSTKAPSLVMDSGARR